MDRFDLSPLGATLTTGAPQRSGPLAMLPLFGEEDDRFPAPLTGLKLSMVKGYGNLELENPSSEGVAIVPLHMGYIQDNAQNHALCRSAFIGAKQKLMFKDACCVQQGQGGYLQGREQWFFILPASLRETALELRGQVGYGKLWPSIAALAARFGLEHKGHLEQVVSRQRFYLTQYASRLELLPGQTGAAFFIEGELAGVEIAPSAAYFAEVFMPLACFCYGAEAMLRETRKKGVRKVGELEASSVDGIRKALEVSRAEFRSELVSGLGRLQKEKLELKEEERWLDLVLSTATSKHFAGQVVREKDRLLYASVTARAKAFLN